MAVFLHKDHGAAIGLLSHAFLVFVSASILQLLSTKENHTTGLDSHCSAFNVFSLGMSVCDHCGHFKSVLTP